MHVVWAPGELVVNVAFAVLHHGDHRCLGEHITRSLRSRQPAARLFVIRWPPSVVDNLSFRTVDELSPHKADDTATFRVHRDDRMNEHTEVLAIAYGAEAVLAAGMSSKVEFRSISNSQHVPSGRARSGHFPSMAQDFVSGDGLVVEKFVKAARLLAVAGQLVQAHGLLPLHRCQQGVARGGQTTITEVAKLGLIHGTRSLPLWCGRANPRLVRGERGGTERGC